MRRGERDDDRSKWQQLCHRIAVATSPKQKWKVVGVRRNRHRPQLCRRRRMLRRCINRSSRDAHGRFLRADIRDRRRKPAFPPETLPSALLSSCFCLTERTGSFVSFFPTSGALFIACNLCSSTPRMARVLPRKKRPGDGLTNDRLRSKNGMHATLSSLVRVYKEESSFEGRIHKGNSKTRQLRIDILDSAALFL